MAIENQKSKIKDQKPADTWQPRILGFLCNWCSYAGADLAGVSRFQYPPTVRIIRVMCSARVEPAFVFRALLRGVDGVLVLGCHFGDCHYISGNYRCRDRMEMTKELLKIAGVNPERLHLGWVSAAEGQQFAQIVANFTEQLIEIGPLGKRESQSEDKLKENLTAAIHALSSDRIRWLIGGRETLVEGESVYREQMSSEEYRELLLESLADEYKCSKVAQAIKDEPLSVKQIASRTEIAPREVLQYVASLKQSGRAVRVDTVDRSPRYGAPEKRVITRVAPTKIAMVKFTPKLVGFLCNWCSYAGADLAGVSRFQYPPNLRIIRVMCSGRIDPVIVLQSLMGEIDGVLVLGCHPGDCHYTTGNLFAEKKMQLTSNFLVEAGIHPHRLHLDWVSAAEGARFADIVTNFTQQIQLLGPIGEAEGLDKGELNDRLSAVQGALSGEELRWLVGQELKLVEEGNVYGERIDEEEYQGLLLDSLVDQYKRGKIAQTIKDKPLSVKEIAGRTDLAPREVLQHIYQLKHSGRAIQVDTVDRSPRYIASGA